MTNVITVNIKNKVYKVGHNSYAITIPNKQCKLLGITSGDILIGRLQKVTLDEAHTENEKRETDGTTNQVCKA